MQAIMIRPHTVRALSVVGVLGIGVGALVGGGGCQSMGGSGVSAREITSTASVIDSPVFVAPVDPAMGQVVVSVPMVKVSAPVPTHQGDIGQAVQSQLMNTLAMSANIVVADRASLGAIATEQQLGVDGVTDPRDAVTPGQLAGARYLIAIDVTEYKEDVVGKSDATRVESGGIFSVLGSVVGGLGGKILGGIGAANPTVGAGTETITGVVGMEVRITDVQTGAIVHATRAHAMLTKANTKQVLGIAGITTSSSSFQQSVLAQATRAAAEDLARQVHGVLRTRWYAQQGATPPTPPAALASNTSR
jgi:hypothetical protein